MDEAPTVGVVGGPVLGVELRTGERAFLVGSELDRTRVGLGQPHKPVGKCWQVVRVRMTEDGGGAEPVVQWMVTDQPNLLVAELGDPAGLVVRVRVSGTVGHSAHANRCHAERVSDELQPTAESKNGKVARRMISRRPSRVLVVRLGWCAMTRDEHRPDSVPLDQVEVDVAVAGKEADIAGQVTESVGDSGAGSEKPVACPLERRGVFVVDVEDHRSILHDPSTEHTRSLAGV